MPTARANPTRNLDRGTALTAVTIAVVALSSRAPGAARDAFWQDEVSSARILTESSPYSALRQVVRLEATPPLWYLLGWLANAVGIGPGGYRWLSALAGAAAAALTVVLARRVLPLWASAVAGLLTALGWQLVMHGRELRAYALLELLAVLFALALTRGPGLVLGLVVATGAMTNYFFGLTVLAGLAWVWLEPTVRRDARRLSAWIGAGLVPLLLWSPALVHQYQGRRFAWIGPFDLGRLVEAPWLLFVHHVPGSGALLPVLFLGAIVVGGAALAVRSPEGRLCALLLGLPLVLAALAWAAGAHVFVSRNLVGIAPFAAVALAALVAMLPRPAGIAVAAAAVASIAFGTVRAESTAPTRYDVIAETLTHEGWSPGDPILLLGDFFSFRSPLEWYLPGRPSLTLGLRSTGRCARLYAVVQGPRDRSRVARSGLLVDGRTIGRVEVGPLRTTRLPAFPGETSLAAPGAGGCVRLVPEGSLDAELQRLRGASA
jgi:hypothetical protein